MADRRRRSEQSKNNHPDIWIRSYLCYLSLLQDKRGEDGMARADPERIEESDIAVVVLAILLANRMGEQPLRLFERRCLNTFTCRQAIKPVLQPEHVRNSGNNRCGT
jgi:hypothetical protein